MNTDTNIYYEETKRDAIAFLRPQIHGLGSAQKSSADSAIAANILLLGVVFILVAFALLNTATSICLFWGIVSSLLILFNTASLKHWKIPFISPRLSEIVFPLLITLMWALAPFLLSPVDKSLPRGVLGFLIGVVIGIGPILLPKVKLRRVYTVIILCSVIVRCFITKNPETFLIGFVPGIIITFVTTRVFNPQTARPLSIKLAICLMAAMEALGGFQVFVSTIIWQHVIQEVDKTNLNGIAGKVAQIIQPQINDSQDFITVEHEFYKISSLNPKLEIYLLSADGEIVANYPTAGHTPRDKLDIKLVQQLNYENARGSTAYINPPFPLKGLRTFDFAPVKLSESEQGYVLVFFKGDLYDLYLRRSILFPMLKCLFSVLSLTILLGFCLAYFVYCYLTRRVNRIAKMIHTYSAGDYSQRLPLTNDDQIDTFVAVANEMADAIVAKDQELKSLDQQRRDLVNEISNHLANPLEQVLDSLNKMIKDSEILSAEQKEQLLQTMHEGALYQSQIVFDLFELSKLDNYQQKIEFESFPLPELIQDTVTQLKASIMKNQIQVNFDPTTPTSEVVGDIEMLSRCCYLLIENCIFHLNSPGKLTIEIRDKGNAVIMTLDTLSLSSHKIEGILIKENLLDISKHNDYQAASILGLPMAVKIIQLNKGHLQIENVSSTHRRISISLPAVSSLSLNSSVTT